MDEKYRLVFRGEVLEGQHKAVVKRRLRELMKLDDSGIEKLFSGTAVVIRRAVDRDTAARYQALFKQAGSRLRVLAEQSDDSATQVATAPAPDATTSTAEPASVKPLPRGAATPAADGDPAFTVISSYFPPPEEPVAEIEAPDFDVAAVGSDLLDAVAEPEVVVPEPEFELAEVGVDLLLERSEPVVADLGALDFEIAEVGADIGVQGPVQAVSTPDISHLRLAER